MQISVLVFLGMLLLCVAKLGHLQLVQHPKYANAALSSLTSEELTPSPRGRIMDCNGRVLAEDVPSFDLSVRPRQLELHELSIESLRRIRAIRRESLARYREIFRGGYAAFAKPEYEDAYAARFAALCAEVPPGGIPSEKVLRKLRYLHYRAERDAAIDRLAESDAVVAEIAGLAGVPRRTLARGVYAALDHAAKRYGGSAPPAATGLNRANWDRLCLRQHYPLIAGKDPIPGVYMTTSVRRLYRWGSTACHVLGYLSPLKEEQYRQLAIKPDGIRNRDHTMDAPGEKGYRWFFKPNAGERNWLRPRGRMTRGRSLTDERVGAYGIERFYNQHLRGKHAYRTWRLKLNPGSVRGGAPEREPLRSPRPRAGGDVKLTLDFGVQRAAERALAETGSKGAVVFLDPNDGGIIALASCPDFSPAVFVDGRPAERLALMTRESRPLFCRAYQGQYPPGSVFKTVVGVAALEEGAIRPGTIFSCAHGLQVGRRWFECMFPHGRLNFTDGLRRSCNTYFFHTGLELERYSQKRTGRRERHYYEEMRRLGGLGYWGKAFGFGRYTGIDLPGENPGLMPDRVWKARRYAGQRGMTSWTDGDTCNVAIGQGAVSVTPLQAAVAMAAIANGGTIVRPHVVQEITPEPLPGEDGLPTGYRRWKLPLKDGSRSLHHVRKAMVAVVNNLGTGRRARMPHVVVAGKTGSAENAHGRTHAWFCGFAPADDPTVAFAVLLENAGHGGAEAAPVARKILEVLFPSERPLKSGEARG